MTSSVTTPRSCRSFLRCKMQDAKNKHLQFYWCVTSRIILNRIQHQHCAQDSNTGAHFPLFSSLAFSVAPCVSVWSLSSSLSAVRASRSEREYWRNQRPNGRLPHTPSLRARTAANSCSFESTVQLLQLSLLIAQLSQELDAPSVVW